MRRNWGGAMSKEKFSGAASARKLEIAAEKWNELVEWAIGSPEPSASQSEVLAHELQAIAARRRELALPRPPIPGVDEKYDRDEAFDAGLLGLAFSGGGIRSATFNLGVLQVLARYGLLRHIDYMSTVSGGGYIGSWLTALIQRTFNGSGEAAFSKQAFRRLEKTLAWSAGDGIVDEHDREHGAIRFLRRYSNYLTPKLGVFSGDTWALLGIYVRNVLLNQLVLVFALVLGLLLPRFLSDGLRALEGAAADWPGVAAMVLIALYGLWTVGRNLASTGAGSHARPTDDTAGVVTRLIVPILSFALLGSIYLPRLVPPEVTGVHWLWALALGAALNVALWSIAALFGYANSDKRTDPKRANFKSAHSRSFWRAALISAAPAGAVLGVLVLFWVDALDRDLYMGYRVAFAPPAFLIALLAAAIVQIGLAGNGFGSRHREWLSRLGGLMGITALVWAALCALVFLSPRLMALPQYVDWPLIGSWLAATLSGVYVGKTTSSAGVPSLIRRVVMGVAPWVFIAGLLVILASAVQLLLGLVATQVPIFSEQVVAPVVQAADVAVTIQRGGAVTWAAYGGWLAATEHVHLLLTVAVPALALAVLFSRRVDINSFSLHNMYANRLVRCFLGATDPDRVEDRFTRFSTQDDLTMCATPRSQSAGCDVYEHRESWRPVEEGVGASRPGVAYPGPYHIVSTALNLAGGADLAWQERKAGSFVMTPLFCGFELSWTGEALATREDSGAAGENGVRGVHGYRPTHLFSARPKALTLGEAMATSGAAASPNMGYHTTPALAFLLGVFNIRLGRWVANPKDFGDYARRKNWRKSGPKFALLHLLREVFGMTHAKSSFVYLSDGGHFENLGIYELVRRRCRYVIACDAGADPRYEFEDLGNAIRKCRIDLGVEIDIDVRQIARRDDAACNGAPCAIGKIRYSDDRIGTLLYIKSSRRAGAPSDVSQYARKHAAFPHESTADQFFSESQFESYRRLGRFLADEVVHDAVPVSQATGSDEIDIDRFFRALEQNWYASSPAVSEHFSALTGQIDALFERLRTSEHLTFLSEQFYPEWQTLLGAETDLPAPHRSQMWNLPTDETSLRHGFYFCNSLIQLMENVYLDLKLESEWRHPDNSGWMNVFRHWTWSSMFRITWAISAATYGRRFRVFCRRQLKLALGEIDVVEIELDTPGGLAAALERGRLNLVERGQITRLAEAWGEGSDRRVYRLDLRVPHMAGLAGEHGPLLRCFGIGYALIADRTLVMYRVQDHLRNMGLGQSGLEKLVTRERGLVVAADIEAQLEAIGETVNGKWIAEFKATLASIQQPLTRSAPRL